MRPDLRSDLQTVQLIKNGFILSSLLWASFLAMAIDRRLYTSALFLAIAGVFTLFGLIHCPLSSNALFLPIAIPGLSDSWVLPAEMQGTVFQLAFGYFLTAGLMLVWGVYLKRTDQTESDFDEA
jgi:AGZA family xanthine/uracil permease-like MFS transporter